MARIATIPLAKDPMRVALVVGLRLGVGFMAFLTGMGSIGTGPFGVALAVVGGLLTAYSLGLAVVLATLRVEVFPHEVRLAAFLFRRKFGLAPGPMTRWRPSGRRRITARVAGFGVRLDDAELSSGEHLTITQLDPTRPVLLVPTTGGRLGLAVDDEDRLIDSVLLATLGR